MKRTNVPGRLRTKASHTAAHDKRPAFVVGSHLGSVKDKWNAPSPFWKHWCKNIALGILIALFILVADIFHFGPVVAFQNWGLDVVTRLNQSTCSMLNLGNDTSSILSRVLRCSETDGPMAPPLLVDVDAETWRSPGWGQGEPDRAPRDAMATLIERAFELGATQVVLDIVVEDHAPLGTPTPPAGSPATLTQSTDQPFADRLRALLRKPHFGPDRRLILVRTERRPLQQDELAFRSELRHSKAVDEVVAASNERIVIAAPYFQVGADRRLRDWDLFKVVCERQTDRPEHGLLRVVPSVQLVTAAFSAGKCPQSPVHIAGQLFKRCTEGTDAHPTKEQAEASWASAMACTPFPAVGAANLPDTESTARACTMALQLDGIRAAHDSRWCAQARMTCRAAENANQAAEPACARLMTRLRAIEAARPGMFQAVWTQITTVHTDEGIDAGIHDGYWSAVQQAFDPHLADLPHEGGVGNRVVFRYLPDQVTTINAGQLLAATEGPLKQFGPLLHGRVVVIGQTFRETGDAHFTPLGRMPGAVVLVNAIDSMSRHGLMQTPPIVVTLSVEFVLIVVVGYLFARWTSAIAAIFATLIIVFSAGVASFFLFGSGVWLNFAAPIIGVLIHSQWDAHEERKKLKRLSQLRGVKHCKPGRRTPCLKRRA